MDKIKFKLLNKNGWTLLCESPLEIEHEDGSFASMKAAEIIIDNLVDYIDEDETNDITNTKVETNILDSFELEIEYDEAGFITDDCISKVVTKILAASNMVYAKSKIGNANKIIFSGKLGSKLCDLLEHYIHLKNFEFKYEKSNEEKIILIREGDYLKLVEKTIEKRKPFKHQRTLEEVINDSKISQIELVRTKEKQPDIMVVLKLIEKK